MIIGVIDVHFTMSDAFFGCKYEISWMRFPGKVMRSAAGLQRGLT